MSSTHCVSWFLPAALPPDVFINVHVHAETKDHMMTVTSKPTVLVGLMMCDTDFLSDLLPGKSQASISDTNLILCTKTSWIWKSKSSLFQMMPFITFKYREL